MKFQHHLAYFIFLNCFYVNLLDAQSVSPASIRPPMPVVEQPVLPSPLSDPIEPFNRAVWNFNVGLLTSVIKPASRGYRFVVPKPAREGIGNFGRNMTYPGRFINEGLQANWQAMGDETARCLCNTIFGLGGLFDVATRCHIPKRDADFGQTFKQWGFQPGIFLMLPLLGPSDVRDGIGLAGDAAANPLNYFVPYSYIGPGVAVNNLSDSVNEAVRFSQSEADSYSILEYAWTFAHENRPVDLRLDGAQDPASLETLQSIFFTYKNPEFLDRGKTRAVLIPATGKKLKYTYWLQCDRAPIVYLIPGLGAHRLAGDELGLAELLVDHGFSVVCVSSTFHPEFMEHASTTDLPDYPPNNIGDLHRALTAIDHQLEIAHPHRLGARALMGYSMGGFQSLFIAATAATNSTSMIQFQRYVAIDAPVRLRYAVTNLDELYQAPMAWPAAQRTANIQNTLMKAVALMAEPPAKRTALPFNTIETRFLIGLSFRLSLRDIIFSSQLQHNQGVLREPIKESRRRAVYDEILKYSFRQYVDQFVAPYDLTLGIDVKNPDVVKRGTDLTAYTSGLEANPNIRLIMNRNDFLLAESDISWAEGTFAPSELTIFPDGGHVGNLSQPAVQQAILQALDGLSTTPITKASGQP